MQCVILTSLCEFIVMSKISFIVLVANWLTDSILLGEESEVETNNDS